MRLGDLLEPRGDTHQGRRDEVVQYALRSAVSGLVGTAVADIAHQTAGPPRDPEERRRLYGDANKYFREVLGWRLTGQQEMILGTVEAHDRVLVAAANNVGKTWLFGGYAVYEMDAGGAVPDLVRELDERGTILLLPGPDHDTIRASIWREILMHLRRALARGVGMPGEWSEKSVLWRTRPDWFAEAFAPMQRVGREVAHTVSGRHHEHMVAIIEEGQGVEETIWRGVEGMCSGAGNKILSPFNPTEPIGAAYARAQSGAYHVIHIDAFGHPNVRSRSVVVPAAIAHSTIDMRVRTQSVDRGALPLVYPDPAYRDFVYALPPAEALERGGRDDGHPGHPDGELHVYRPNGLFQGQVLGVWPDTTNTGLFDLQTINAAMARGRATPEPIDPPSRVGVDAAREGDDDCVTAPSWGESAEALLNAWAQARLDGEHAVRRLLAKRRVRVGAMRVMQKGDGPFIARQIYALYPRSPWNVDDGGQGVSVLDHGGIVLGADAIGVTFGGEAPQPTPGEPWSENMRTALYVRVAMLFARGLIDVDDDPLLREELMAHRIEHKTRTVDEIDDDGEKRRVRVASVQLIEKKLIKKLIGRSPDRADALVLSVFAPSTLGPRITAHLLSEDAAFERPKPATPLEAKIQQHYPVLEVTEDTCATCAFRSTKPGQPDVPFCSRRGFEINVKDPACARYEAASRGGV